MSSGVVLLGQELLAKIARLDASPHPSPFTGTFERFRNRNIPHKNIPYLYLEALANKYHAEGSAPGVQQAFFVQDAMASSNHLLWFGVIADDYPALNIMCDAYGSISRRGVEAMVGLWNHFEVKRMQMHRGHYPRTPEARRQEQMLEEKLRQRQIPTDPPRPIHTEQQMTRELKQLYDAAQQPKQPQKKKSVTIVDPLDPLVVFSWGPSASRDN